MKQRFKVGILYGGQSGEHEISLLSAHWVAHHLDRDLYEPVFIGIDKSGQCWLNQPNEVYDPKAKGLSVKGPGSQAIFLGDPACELDVVFPAIHGPLYEDGHLQGALALAGLACVSPGMLTCAVAMNKHITKRLAQSVGIPVVPWVTVDRNAFFSEQKGSILQHIQDELTLPLIVKPANMGSSVGVTAVNELAALPEAIAFALQYDHQVLVELKVFARELEVAVLQDRNGAPRTTPPGEVIVSQDHDFYSYAAKYEDPNGASLSIPANIPEALSHRCQDYARTLFSESAGRGMARIDFLYETASDRLYLNDFNPIPGLTAISLYPKLWEYAGLSAKALISELIDLALINAERDRQLQRDYSKAVIPAKAGI